MRAAADELRAELAGDDGDVRRQPQHQLHEHLRRRLRVLRVRPGKALAGRVPRLRGRLPGADRGGGRVRSDRDLHAGRDPPRLHARALRALAAAGEGGGAADPPARLLADGDPLHVRALRACPGRRLRLPARGGPGVDPGTAAEVLHDGVRTRISPNKLPVARWVEIIEACHRVGPAVDIDGDVRPYRGAMGAGAPYAGRFASFRSGRAGSPSSCR